MNFNSSKPCYWLLNLLNLWGPALSYSRSTLTNASNKTWQISSCPLKTRVKRSSWTFSSWSFSSGNVWVEIYKPILAYEIHNRRSLRRFQSGASIRSLWSNSPIRQERLFFQRLIEATESTSKVVIQFRKPKKKFQTHGCCSDHSHWPVYTDRVHIQCRYWSVFIEFPMYYFADGNVRRRSCHPATTSRPGWFIKMFKKKPNETKFKRKLSSSCNLWSCTSLSASPVWHRR